MRYLHYAPRAEDARLVAEAFKLTTQPTDAASDRPVDDDAHSGLG